MPAYGGPSNQSGILYQNSIAAIYMGRLCDPAERLGRDCVTDVRVEAPEHVDDTVVTFADGHRAYIQAKENVRPGQSDWRKLWRDFEAQFHDAEFRRERDRLILCVSEVHEEH